MAVFETFLSKNLVVSQNVSTFALAFEKSLLLAIKEVIEAGANAVTFTPPTSAEIFKGMMENYREQMKK